MKREKSYKKTVLSTDKKENKLDVSDGIEYKPLCPVDIAKINSKEAILSRSFSIYDMVANFKRDLHIRCFMDYYGGYAEHGRQVVFGLNDTGRYNIKVTNIRTPVDVDPVTWQKVNWFTTNQIDVKNSDFLIIAGPGWFQKDFLPENRRILGWTMIESMNFGDRFIPWLKNADVMFCPTDIDIRRAKEAKLNNPTKMRLGYDDKLFHPNVEPIKFHGIPEGNIVFGVLGSWNLRKGIRETIQAYCEAFDNKSNTTLLLCCKYGNRKWGKEKENEDRWTIQYEFSKLLDEIGKPKEILPHIALIDIPVHEVVVPHIMASFDCLVGFSSGESTWLPGLQAMAMEIPVIQLANDCCGYMEYMNKDNSLLCETVCYEKCTEEFWQTTSEYYEGQVFGYGDYKELVEKIRFMKDAIESNKACVKTMTSLAKDGVSQWTWKDSIKKLDGFLSKY